MILRQLLAVLALASMTLCANAQTGSVKTPGQLNSEVNNLYLDNSSGAITPFDLRQVGLDQVASAAFLNFPNVFLQNQTVPGLTINTITGSTQCLHVSTAGLISGTGTDCGAAGGNPGGSNTQVQYNHSGSFGGITGATTNGTTVTLISPIIDTAVSWLFSGSAVGSETVSNPSGTTPTGSYIVTWQGATVGGTTAVHLIPASGPLAGTVTTSEYVAGVTLLQAFGGNYGRWSYSNFASALSGIVGEYGGTVTPADFNLQIGIENPPSTFTSYEFWRAQTTAGTSEDNQIGAMLFGANQPNPATQQNRIVLIKPSIGSAGTRNSDAILWEGKANNGSDLATWWRQYVNVLTNAGASCLNFDNNLNGNGGAYVNNASLCDTGIFNARTGLSIAGAPISASSLSNGVTGSGAVVLATGATINPTAIVGVTTNSNAPAGDVGEYLVSACGVQNTTVTITIASPAVVTWTAHGFSNTLPHQDTCPITFSTTGALPTGITAGTTYWIDPASITTNTFKIATSVANALAGTDVTTTGTQSGTQSAVATVAITNGNSFTVTGLNTTAGDWDCNTVLVDNPAGSTVVTLLTAAVSQTNNTLPSLLTGNNAPAYGNTAGSSTGTGRVASSSTGRYLNSTTTPTYAIVNAAFTVSTDAGWGNMRCRRMR